MTTQREEHTAGKRLAICLSGGGSLGAYEAGAMYELLRALEFHNKNTSAAADKIFIDVFTGASAGAINSMLLSFLISYAGDSFVGATNNPLYEYWVEDAYMYHLESQDGLAVHTPDGYTVLDPEYLGKIALKQFNKRYASGKTAKRHPAASDKVSIGLALANMTGLDFEIEYSQKPAGKKFTYTRYEDGYCTEVSGDNTDTLGYWRRVLEHALASGGFPFGLKCREVRRIKSEYPPDVDLTLAKWPNQTDEADFAYSDGGLFNNQPLGLARSIAKSMDIDKIDAKRAYLYISPFDKKSSITKSFHADDANFVNLAVQLLKVIFVQSQYQDWITALGDQKEQYLLKALADALVGAMQENSEAGKAIIETTLQSLSQSDDPEIKAIADGASGLTPDAALNRLLSGFIPNYREDSMALNAITPDTNLCGRDLLTFKGFFRKSFRLHDYTVGRKNALCWLESVTNDTTLGPIKLPTEHEPLDSAEIPCEELVLDPREIALFRDIAPKWMSALKEFG